jgi:ABC-type transport system involved in multi-copper enzyme maturation permease subunit
MMLGLLIEKELKAILLSPKFSAIFGVCSILIVLSIYIGIQEYRVSMAHYEANNSLVDREMREQTRWSGVGTKVTRYPDPMQIFVSGIHNDIGRQSSVSAVIKLRNSHYSDNTIFAVFRSMDLMFIVQIVLSLFAILFTYDAINGERETGTLKLNFANPIPRGRYIVAKLIGSWLGLVIPLLIPLLLGIALVLLYRIPMSATSWLQLGLFLGVSVLYFSFFICLGVLMSSLTRQSSGSFLYLLVIWVSFVLIIPRAGVMIAGQIIPVPTAAEISSQRSQKVRELYRQFTEKLKERSRKLDATFENMSPDERQSRNKELIDEYQKKYMDDQERISQEIAEYDAFLNEDWRNRKAHRVRLGFSLSRFSPASAYQLAAMELAGTGISLKTRYEDQLRAFWNIFDSFRTKKIKDSGGIFYNPMNKKVEPLDFSEVPKFEFVKTDLNMVLQSTLIDIGLLCIYILIAIAGTVVAFLRYDVR